MKILQHKFVEFIPQTIEDGVLYISIDYCTAIHKCVCGCGNEVVTPLSPTDWQLAFNGKTITLYPSIGNWSFDCKSHYWIRDNRIKVARPWMEREISRGRENDFRRKSDYFEVHTTMPQDSVVVSKKSKPSYWKNVLFWFGLSKG